ncbi:MAG TPA: response regulator transcription factor [Vicinamibacterales bacterium]|nr:response regulator transcription factor [Vicinamibacterales bacterium]
MPIRIAIADDHALVLHGLKRLFDGEAEFDVVECCSSGEEALAVARAGNVDVLLLDIKMRGLSGIDVLRIMSAQRLKCSVVLLTAAVSDRDAVEGLRLGARGILLKEASPDTLLECIRRVSRGEQWIDSDTMSRAVDTAARRTSLATDPRRILTARELEIVRMIAQGLRNKAIAERLSISEGTVKIHLHNVYEKLDLDGRMELMLHAQKQGLG